MALGSSCRYSLARTVGMRSEILFVPAPVFLMPTMAPLPPAAAASLDSSLLLRHLLNPSLPHLLCHLTLIPSRCPLFQPLHPLIPSCSQFKGKHLEEEPTLPAFLCLPPAGSSRGPFSLREWQPPALSRQLLPVTARAAELHSQAFVTRHLDRCHLGDPESCSQPRPTPLGFCCILPEPLARAGIITSVSWGRAGQGAEVALASGE